MPASGKQPTGLDQLSEQALQLPYEDQAVLQARLRDNLLDAGFEEEPEDRLLRVQKEALDAMRQVARAQGLPDGQAPKTTGFNQAAESLGLDWTVRRVGLAYRKWSLATRRYETGRTPSAARFVPHRKNLEGRKVKTTRAHLDEVARWLQEEPPPHTRTHYGKWRNQENRNRHQQGQWLLVEWRSLQQLLPELSFEDIIAVAKDPTISCEDLCRQRAGERLATQPNPLRVCAPVTIAALADTSWPVMKERLKRPDAPKPVFRVAKSSAYLVEDVAQWIDGDKAPARAALELQHLVKDIYEVAELIERDSGDINDTISRQTWHLAPPPSGAVAGGHYWLTDRLQRWMERRPTREEVRDGAWTPDSLLS